jgi:metallo-beta-lactamase class B
MMKALALALWAMGTASAPPSVADDPLTRPMAVERAKQWLAPLPPEKLFGSTYLVGFGGLSVALIDTGEGWCWSTARCRRPRR